MSEGHRVIAQDTVTNAIGHFYVKGLDNINFTFTLYSGQDTVWRATAVSPPKLKHPKKRVNKNILFSENNSEVLERAQNSHSAQFCDLMYSGSVLILLEKSSDGSLFC